MRFMSWRLLLKRNVPMRLQIVPNDLDILQELPEALLIIPEQNKQISIDISYLLDKEEVTSYGIYLEADDRKAVYQKILVSIEETRKSYQKRKGTEAGKVVALGVTVFYKNDKSKNETVLLVNAKFYRERKWLY